MNRAFAGVFARKHLNMLPALGKKLLILITLFIIRSFVRSCRS